MTMLKAARYNIRRQETPAAPAPRPAPVLVATATPGEMLFDNPEDGFGDQKFETAGARSHPGPGPGTPAALRNQSPPPGQRRIIRSRMSWQRSARKG